MSQNTGDMSNLILPKSMHDYFWKFQKATFNTGLDYYVFCTAAGQQRGDDMVWISGTSNRGDSWGHRWITVHGWVDEGSDTCTEGQSKKTATAPENQVDSLYTNIIH